MFVIVSLKDQNQGDYSFLPMYNWFEYWCGKKTIIFQRIVNRLKRFAYQFERIRNAFERPATPLGTCLWFETQLLKLGR